MPEQPAQLTSSMLRKWYHKLCLEPMDSVDGDFWLIASKRTVNYLRQKGRFRKCTMSNRARRKYRNMKRSRQ